MIRINPDVIFVPTRFIDKLPDYKQDIDAIMNDSDLQNVRAVKRLCLSSSGTICDELFLESFHGHGTNGKMALWS